jgi:ATP adenylyltransferase
LKSDELAELNSLCQKGLRALSQAFKPEGFNLGVNLGRAAGAGIADHVHQHIVPRWSGDFNFMPLFGEVKVISEHLNTTYDRIVKAWGEV